MNKFMKPTLPSSLIYLDYAATTPLDPRVKKAMEPYFFYKFGNPASLHQAGQEASVAVETARQSLAAGIAAQASEIIFSSSATESNNLALKGVAWASTSKSRRKKIVVSTVEHDCVLNAAKWLSSRGFEVEFLQVDQYGVVDLTQLSDILKKEDVLLVSVIHANNEIGTIQPIAKIGKLCRQHGTLFHVDAAQTLGKEVINVGRMKIDLLTASSHKIYGPKGVGLLFCREGVKLTPLFHGGGQEDGRRSSTLNVPGIVGFGKAVELALKERESESKKIAKLRDLLQKQLLELISNSYLNGHPSNRLYNNLNIRFDFIEGESLVIGISQKGVAASTGSACSSPKLEPSHVLLATGVKPEQAHGSLRLSLGRWTTKKEIEQAVKIIQQMVNRLRQLSPYKVSKK